MGILEANLETSRRRVPEGRIKSRTGRGARSLGIDAVVLNEECPKLAYRFQGSDFRLTDVRGVVVRKLLA